MSHRDAQVLGLCFLPFISHTLLRVNFCSGYKLRGQGSACSFLSDSFFFVSEEQWLYCNACFKSVNRSLHVLLGRPSCLASPAYLFFKRLLSMWKKKNFKKAALSPSGICNQLVKAAQECPYFKRE